MHCPEAYSSSTQVPPPGETLQVLAAGLCPQEASYHKVSSTSIHVLHVSSNALHTCTTHIYYMYYTCTTHILHSPVHTYTTHVSLCHTTCVLHYPPYIYRYTKCTTHVLTTWPCPAPHLYPGRKVGVCLLRARTTQVAEGCERDVRGDVAEQGAADAPQAAASKPGGLYGLHHGGGDNDLQSCHQSSPVITSHTTCHQQPHNILQHQPQTHPSPAIKHSPPPTYTHTT